MFKKINSAISLNIIKQTFGYLILYKQTFKK